MKTQNEDRKRNARNELRSQGYLEISGRNPSELCSMVSEDALANGIGKDLKYNKEESKGKRSSSEDVINCSDKNKTDNFIKSPYMHPIKINDTNDGKSTTEYYYEFGEEIPYELANLLGKVVGKALFEAVPITPRLNHFLLKCMLAQDFELEDMKTYDQGIMSSVTYMMNNNFNPTDMNLTFSFIDDKKYSDNELITNNNKQVFLELLLNYYGYQKHMRSINLFLEGLYSVVPMKLLNLLEIGDLEKLLIGTRTIDISNWRVFTRYINKTELNSHIIEWFWETLLELKDEELRKLLQFCTGCQSIPIEGFANLKNNRQED